MTEFEISRATGKCCVTGREFAEDQEFFTVVLETADGLARQDYSVEVWTGPPDGTLCFFKTRLPKRNQPKRRFIDDSALISFFNALADTPHPNKQRFRFVLALILLRKRILKYERTIREGDSEIWEMRLVKHKTVHRVVNPVLREDEIGSVSAELGVVLNGYVVDEVRGETDPLDDEAHSENESNQPGDSRLTEPEEAVAGEDERL
ncbi:MAG TPA: hypothetical protein VNT79_15830 [Phycisphaerae bacterium]|nr:hypothetical protein [Phycisphaerae bacterium]